MNISLIILSFTGNPLDIRGYLWVSKHGLAMDSRFKDRSYFDSELCVIFSVLNVIYCS